MGGVIMNLIFPISGSPYWFIQVYFLLIIISPLLNIGLQHMQIRKLNIWITIFTFITIVSCGFGHNISNANGCTILQAIYMYCLGYTLHNQCESIKKIGKLGFLCIWLVVMTLGGLIVYYTRIQSFTAFNGLFNVICAIALFLCFSKIHIQSNIINSISKAAFGCYLLSDGLIGIYILYPLCNSLWINYSNTYAFAITISSFIFLWVISIVISYGVSFLSNFTWAKILRPQISRFEI